MNERELAYRSLEKIVIDKQFSNIVLRNNKENTAFVTQLVYGTLRNYRLCRNAWEKYANKKPNSHIAVLLDMAVYELLMLDTPDYATINEIVSLAKGIKGGASSNFVNAILHKVSKEDLNTDDIGIVTSHPDWLVNLWKAHYGNEVMEKICYEDIKEPKIALRINTLLTTKDILLQDKRFTPGQVEDCLYYKGNILESDYYKNNNVIIQSESSQKAVNTLDVNEGMQILDLCGAPGSKSIQLAMKLDGSGKVVSNDIYDFRVELIKNNARRYNLKNIEACCHDGLKINEFYKEESFDAVLLDAPCSGLGTIKHKPEIKQNIQTNDLDDIVSLQKGLLEVAGKMVKKGGQLVYSTCTLNKKENERQVEAFLKNNANYSLVSEETIFPFTYHSDGFFIAKMIREN